MLPWYFGRFLAIGELATKSLIMLPFTALLTETGRLVDKSLP